VPLTFAKPSGYAIVASLDGQERARAGFTVLSATAASGPPPT